MNIFIINIAILKGIQETSKITIINFIIIKLKILIIEI